MIRGGNATIYVRDFDTSIRFYTEVLGLELRMRIGTDWAEVDAGAGLVIGMHPVDSPYLPEPGTRGSITIGLLVDEPLDQVMTTLRERGVEFRGPVIEDGDVRFAFFADPDGNGLYLTEVPDRGEI